MLCCVVEVVVPDFSMDSIASIFRVEYSTTPFTYRAAGLATRASTARL
jgi:hypothetical protein